MSFKEILVYADTDKQNAARLAAAADIARKFQAHLVALHVKTPPYIPVELGAGVPADLIAWQEKYQQDEAAKAKKAVDDLRQKSGLDIEWREAYGEMAGTALLHSRYADLLVVSQSALPDDEPQDTDILPEALVVGSGRPVLMFPRYNSAKTLGENVLIAWKRTRESTRAVHDALPLLKLAKKVTVMEVNPEDEAHPAGAEIAHHLARHGVKVEVASITAKDIDTGDAILSRAADVGADLLVMGGYGHSRLREFAFGGVTLHILRHMTIPAFMAN